MIERRLWPRQFAYWQTEYAVAAEDVHANSDLDLDHIFAWMDVDLSVTDRGPVVER
jgi:hypothetical protein